MARHKVALKLQLRHGAVLQSVPLYDADLACMLDALRARNRDPRAVRLIDLLEQVRERAYNGTPVQK